MTVKVVGISFHNNNQIYYFDPKDFDLHRNVTVIVQTERGKQFGKIELPPFFIDEQIIKSPLKEVIRVSTKKDYIKHKKNIIDEENALSTCKELIKKNNLDMQLIDASFTFDKSQLLFRFTAENRIDFRELAKQLANEYKTRIELRQIGIRDKAKEVGGCGLCGRKLCCARFNNGEFATVSINMAKNQNLSLNPSKINGVCGRLLCCLRYENDNYNEFRKKLPKIGTIVETKKGKGKVISLNLIEQKYSVKVNDEIIEIILDGNN